MFRAPACSSPDPGHVRSEAIQSVGTERLLVASGDNLIVVTEALKRPPQLVVVDMPPAVVIQPTDILANQPVGGSRLFSRKIATVMPLGADKDLHTASNDGLAARGQSQQTNDNSTLKESQRKQQRQTTGEDIGNTSLAPKQVLVQPRIQGFYQLYKATQTWLPRSRLRSSLQSLLWKGNNSSPSNRESN